LRFRAEKSSRHTGGLEVASYAARPSESDGSGALTRRRWVLAVSSVIALLALFFASGASALSQRPLKGEFGSFTSASGIVIDQATGDVLIANDGEETISRFHADGTAAPFEALDTNTIDGKEANGKPCTEEPASCDQTPENRIAVPSGGQAGAFQIAIDESGGPTDGDIYLTQPEAELVYIFAEDGRYLGRLTEAGSRAFAGPPKGVAIDSTGTVYLSLERTIAKFVPKANPASNGDFVENFGTWSGIGHDLAAGSGPTAGSVFVTYEGATTFSFEKVAQFNTATGELESEFGANTKGVVALGPVTHTVLDGSGSEYEVPGDSEPVRIARFIPTSEVLGEAIDAANEVLVAEGGAVSLYGLPAVVPTVTTEPAAEVIGTKATFTGTVNPSGLPLTKCVFQYSGSGVPSSEIPCEPGDWETATDSSPHTVRATVSGLSPNGHTYSFRLLAFNENGQEETEFRSFTTARTVVTEPATGIGQAAATLNGIVRPEGSAYTECFFEYGLSSNVSFEGKVPCTPGVAGISGDFLPHEVKASITGLQSGSSYRYRLVATNGSFGTLAGEEETFTTFGLPRIEEVHASGADQGSVTLEARINPSGFGTSYRFEWGGTSAYGNVAPVEFAPFIGSGTEPVLVQAKISGLAAGSTYHYRVSAMSNRGTVRTPDEVAETLDSCGLPEGRCFELVSRSEAGPVAIPGESNAHIEMHFQAATAGPGALAYPVESGYPDATKSADVLYRAERGAGSWESTQLSSPILAVNERSDSASVSNATEWLSNDLSCGFTDSSQPLTSDPSMKLVREEGGSNLYRINPDGSYTGVSSLAPENGEGANAIPDYVVAGASQDCNVTLFATRYAYRGIPTEVSGSAGSRLYEWNHGTLRSAGIVPGPDGEESVAADAGWKGGNITQVDTQNAVSEDGSRVFITAERQTSSNPAEVGKKAVFVREDGSESRDVSLSETGVPDEGAQYQWATADGSKVFFTANAGLAEESNSEGTDLYEYNLKTEELTDRSLTSAAGGAEVTGLLGASADGSQVYFASRNQLIPGAGRSRAQNASANSYSIYGEKGSEVSFVGTFNQEDLGQVLIENQELWNSQVSPEGRYLLFESSARVTGYESDGQHEAYLYDAKTKATTCISCRQDGQPSPDERYGQPTYSVLTRGNGVFNPLHAPHFLTIRNGEPQVFFSSPDPLAPGATEGQNNVYEWSHNQIFRLVSAQAGAQQAPFPGQVAYFGGASDDASDVYLITPETLTWQDGDERLSAYDARVGGGFAEPPAPPPSCLPDAEHSCQVPVQGPAATPDSTTTANRGQQNLEPKKKSAPKKKQKKKQKHKKKSQHKKKSKQKANGNRRNGK
jgi:hypothetical protein